MALIVWLLLCLLLIIILNITHLTEPVYYVNLEMKSGKTYNFILEINLKDFLKDLESKKQICVSINGVEEIIDTSEILTYSIEEVL